MYVRDPALLRRPARWLNAMVRTWNAWFLWFWINAFVILLLNVMPKDLVQPLVPICLGLFFIFGLLGLAALPAWFAIRFGLVKCPCCGSKYDNRKLGYMLERKCDNCGFDVANVSRQGDF
jgi:hypothetical protein